MKTEDFFQRKDCRICQSSSIEKVVELTPTPPGNNFLLKDQISTKEKEYPLELHFCNNCYQKNIYNYDTNSKDIIQTPYVITYPNNCVNN